MSSLPRPRRLLHPWGALRHTSIARGVRGPLGIDLFLESRYLTCLILLAALALRLWRLGDANLWWDEALAVWAVRKGLVGATLWTASDVHPPLYFWSLWAWVQLFGQSEFAMRSLSALAGVLTVALVYAVGARLDGRRTGNLAALFTALARLHVWWSQEMRMYVLAGLLGVASIYFLLRWWESESNLSAPRGSQGIWLAAYAASAVGALYTVLLMGAFLVAQNATVLIAWLWDGRNKRLPTLARWFLGQSAIAALLAAWVVFSWGRMRTWSVANTPMNLLLYMRLYGTLLTTGISEQIDRYTPALLLPLLVLALAGGQVLVRWRKRRIDPGTGATGALLLGMIVAGGGAAIYLATLPRSLFYTPHVEARYFLPFAPAFWILLAWGVAIVTRRWRRVGTALGIALLALWLLVLPGYYRGRYLRDTLQTMARSIVSQAQEGDVVLLDAGNRYPIFLYYYDGLAPGLWRPPMVQIPPGEGMFAPEKVQPTLEPLWQDHKRIWLAHVDVNLADPQELARRWLDERASPVLAQRFGANVLYLYDAQRRTPTLRDEYPAQYAIEARVGTNGMLRGWELPVATYTGGDTAHLSLLWESTPDEAVWVDLRTADGRVLAARGAEAQPGAADHRQQFDWPVYAATPGGAYRIIVSTPEGPEVDLGHLTVSGTRPGSRSDRPAVFVNAQLGDNIALIGYTLRRARDTAPLRVAAGETLTLDLYWRAERKSQRDYTVFTHLLGQAHNPRTDGPVWAQHDSQPLEGGYPTSQWLEGQTVVDRHSLTVDEGAPEGQYHLEIGMYTVEDGQRLAVSGPDGHAWGDYVLLETPVTIARR